MILPHCLKKFRQVSFPFYGSFFLFSIDPIECVRHLNDPELDKIALEMKPKRYLGLVDSINSWDRSGPYVVYRVIMVSHGLPSPDEPEGIKQDMCLPILPTTYHPTNRVPIRPTKPLPFDNCYFHMLSKMANVRVKTTWRRRNDATTLKPVEKAREYVTSGEDMCRRETAKMEYEERKAGRPIAPQGGSTDESMVDDDDDSDMDSEDMIPLFDDDNMFNVLFGQGLADDSIIAITNITYNLSLAKGGDFSEPDEFFEEEAYLRGLMDQSKARAIERARQIDEATYGLGRERESIEGAAPPPPPPQPEREPELKCPPVNAEKINPDANVCVAFLGAVATSLDKFKAWFDVKLSGLRKTKPSSRDQMLRESAPEAWRS